MKKTFSTVFCASVLMVSSLFSDITSNLDTYVKIDCSITSRGSKVHTHPQMTTDPGTSLNWSGYASSPDGAKNVTSVTATWTVPQIKPSSSQSYTAIWVGMDGFSNETVEQIGTEHDDIDGIQKNTAWFDMYPLPSYQINGFPLHVGDVIQAEVEHKGNHDFQLSIVNHTQHVYAIVPSRYTQSKLAKRNSAEWIVEALYSSTVEPLLEFNEVAFTNCTAKMGEISGGIEQANWETKPIYMVTSFGAAKARPSSLSDCKESFLVKWHHE